MVEYSFLAAFIAALIVAVVLLVGRQSREQFCAPAQEFGRTGQAGDADPATVCP